MRLGMLGVASWQQWLWALIVGVQICICYLIVRRGTSNCLPFFLFFLASDFALSVVEFESYRLWGFSSLASYVLVWSAHTVVTATRGMAVAEICRNCLHRYEGIWAMGWRILAGVAAIVVLYAAVDTLAARQKAFWLGVARMVLAANRGLELALVAVLLAFLVFARYYRVELHPPHKALAIGFCFFSCVIVLNDTILSVFLKQYAPLWNGIETSSYFVVLVAWGRAFYKLVPDRHLAPNLIPQAMYDEQVPQMNARLRLLNDRLIGALKS